MDSSIDKPASDITETQATQYRGPDRRKLTLSSILYGMLNPRRRRIRRSTDEENAFLDWHPKRILVAATTILLLSTFDGFLTVYLVSNGASEINPLLGTLVSRDPATFAVAKWFVTACAVVVLVIAAHARVFSRFRAEAVLYAAIVFYVVLIMYSLSVAAMI